MKPPHELEALGASAGGVSQRFDLQSLYRSEMPRLVAFFRRRLGSSDDTADLAQETFLRFVRAAPSALIETPEAYLHQIAINLLRDRAVHSATRMSALQVPLDEGFHRSEQIDQHRMLESREQLAYYRDILSRLKPKTLTIFLLHRIEQRTYRQIGDEFGMTESGVKRHMMKAIAHLARAKSRRP